MLLLRSSAAHLIGGEIFKIAGRYTSQREYATRLGPVVLEQTRASHSMRPEHAITRKRLAFARVEPAKTDPQIVASGTAASGARYVVIALTPAERVVQVTVGETLLSARVPSGTPTGIVTGFVNSLGR